MAEESDAEKTEAASPRRLEQAREEGDVPRSREVATFTVLMAAGAGLWMTGSGLVRQLSHTLVSGLSLTRDQVFDPDVLIHRILLDLVQVLIACLPLGAAVMVVALASPLLVGGWLFSSKAFTPNFMKLNPINGISNMFSTNSLVELVKAIIKTIVVGAVAWVVISRQKEAMFGLISEPLNATNGVVGAHLALDGILKNRTKHADRSRGRGLATVPCDLKHKVVNILLGNCGH